MIVLDLVRQLIDNSAPDGTVKKFNSLLKEIDPDYEETDGWNQSVHIPDPNDPEYETEVNDISVSSTWISLLPEESYQQNDSERFCEHCGMEQ
jgi:hypothetical protein